ncbi:hypothetical protein MRS44_003913 [Fusarium solani]|uniref:uncharacterized protein n=1 Tax=Fusarium solani TaxID=169388 RepID=UPI0032C48FB1|nr:hypothetical protein MRS44_003913 [Fusarium solani]
MAPGSVICLSSFICVSFASRYWQILITQGVIFGVGNALLYYPTTTVIARSFSHNRSLALGIAASGSSIGGIYWPLIVEKLLNHVGFQWTHRAVAVICLPLFALGCLMVRERATERARSANERPTTPSGKATTLFRDAEYVLLSVSLLFIYMGMLVPFYYIPLRAIYHGISDDAANSLLPICYASSFLGRVITGAQADHLGRHEDQSSANGSITANHSVRNRFNTLVIMSVITGIGTLCWTFMSSFGAMVSFAILFGFCSGGLIPLGAGCVAQITPETGSTRALVGGPIGGSLLELGQHGNNWAAVNYFSGITVLVGSAITVCVRVRWRGAGQVVF